MLHEKYLPEYHFHEVHATTIKKPPQLIFPLLVTLDFSHSWLIRVLFWLRGMPRDMMNLRGLSDNRFLELERIPDREIIIGLIGQFYRPDGNLQPFEPSGFIAFQQEGFLKATWNFKLIPLDDHHTKLETETRIFCMGDPVRKKFRLYWFFIRPFSGLIRLEVLRILRKKAESP